MDKDSRTFNFQLLPCRWIGIEAKEQEVGKAQHIALQLSFLQRKVIGEKYCCADKHTRLSSKHSAGDSLNTSVTNFSKS